jgi:hypothetical protein
MPQPAHHLGGDGCAFIVIFQFGEHFAGGESFQ